ncbi:unnamed protein product [Orchesella dallaii]|uniref:SP-RING-type domain-containing protein n=1 Tax=Orchesella dallaii TaxID=48710 RepID=A0ABP1S9H3_9HEXA
MDMDMDMEEAELRIDAAVLRLKGMIKEFSNHELRGLLNSAGVRSIGLPKRVMRARCWKFIQTGVIPAEKIFSMCKNLSRSDLSIERPTVEQPLPNDSAAASSSLSRESQVGSQVTPFDTDPSTSSSKDDDVFPCSIIIPADGPTQDSVFGSLFYQPLGAIMEPTLLRPFTNMRFKLTPEQAMQVQEYCPGVEVWMRYGSSYDVFAPLDKSNMFPPMLTLKMNGYKVRQPTEMTSLTRVAFNCISPFCWNVLELSWLTSSDDNWAMLMYLVKKVTTEELLERLRRKGVRLEEETIKMVQDKLLRDEPNGSSEEGYDVSLLDPIGKGRIVLPCRPTTCCHVQCFDARTFFKRQEMSPFSALLCPVCDKRFEFDDLRIDEYFKYVVDELLPTEESTIRICHNGMWYPVTTSVTALVQVKDEDVDAD